MLDANIEYMELDLLACGFPSLKQVNELREFKLKKVVATNTTRFSIKKSDDLYALRKLPFSFPDFFEISVSVEILKTQKQIDEFLLLPVFSEHTRRGFVRSFYCSHVFTFSIPE